MSLWQEMQEAQERHARAQRRMKLAIWIAAISLGLALGWLLHDTPARVAAVVLQAEACDGQ